MPNSIYFIFFRFYLYALNGLLCEIIFTAIWDSIEKFVYSGEVDLKLIGHSHIWALFIYGTAMLWGRVRDIFFLILNLNKH